MHRTNTWEKKQQPEKTMLLFKQRVILMQTAHLKALQSLFKTEEKWFKVLKKIPLLNLKNKKTLVADSPLISYAQEIQSLQSTKQFVSL